MTGIQVFDQGKDGLAALFPENERISDFSELSDGARLLWIPNQATVAVDVFDLTKQIDSRHLKLEQILILTIAGINGELSSAQLQSLYGPDFKNLVLDYQYATKMIDELEFPYTIVRVPLVIPDDTAVVISNEGQPIVGTSIGQKQLAEVLSVAITTELYLNKSIGVANR